jgi:salicylate hydroxylase
MNSAKATVKPFHIAIIGGGITGLVLALALTKRRIPCTIYERAPSFGEIGAGVAISVNAARALSLCDVTEDELQAEGWFDSAVDESGNGPKRMGPIYAALDRCATHNTFADHRDVWFDFLDGTSPADAKDLKPLFQLRDRSGFPQSCGVHRAKSLEEMVQLLPETVAHFGKDFVGLADDGAGEDGRGGKLTLKFRDGSTAEADAIVGCDGINSRTREVVLGKGHPALKAVYTGKYVYRGLIPIEDAVKAVGEEKAKNAQLWVSRPRYACSPVRSSRYAAARYHSLERSKY